MYYSLHTLKNDLKINEMKNIKKKLGRDKWNNSINYSAFVSFGYSKL